ncbi:unnamed protein product [Brachionus calyciflorus]|uniref:Serine aminopeptidase S33 domain-containing protein n=1 Tax=Brachionus calyciflorus TaxID=104777 RepID=A0A813UUG9_9BILA|nr:unnamed protein product [Brachionus calyciflorus]
MLPSIVGVWNATIPQVVPILIIAHFLKNGDTYGGYLDVPTQNAYKIRIDIFYFKQSFITFNLTSIKHSFEGSFKDENKLTGILFGNGFKFPIDFIKIKNQSEYAVNRPQTPKRPFKYIEEQVEIKHPNITLSGTLTYPKNKKPIASVVVCHGSGGHDRDETIYDHKKFMVLANFLTNLDIAVLRYDERGIRNSSGNFLKSNDVDFAQDAIAGLEFLKSRKETKKSKLDLIGHSKGGFTSIIASNKSKLVNFMVLLGSPSVSGEEILYEQTRLILKSQNTTEKKIQISLEIAHYFKLILSNAATDEEKNFIQIAMNNVFLGLESMTTPWYRSFLIFDPSKILSKTRIPVLGIWGSKDTQVSAFQNLQPMRNALEKARNKKYKLVTFDGLNHLFQTSLTGSPDEYGLIEETFSIEVLNLIGKWIKKIS